MTTPKHHAFCSTALLATLAVLSGCNWNTFDDIIDDAAIRVYDVPSDYRKSAYGAVLTSLRMDQGTANDSTRLVASAGADSPVVVETVWLKDNFADSTSIRCKKKSDCDKGLGIGGVLIPFPLWGRTTPMPQTGCVLTPGTPNAYVLCESNVGTSQNYALNLEGVTEDKATVRFSGASLPKSHPLGVALLGAHATRNLNKQPVNGTLFYQPDMTGESKGNVPKNKVLDVIDPRTKVPFGGGEQGADFAHTVATYPLADDKVMIAIAQPAKNQVIVAVYDPALVPPDGLDERDAQAFRTHTHACVKSPDASIKGFGKVLLLGDVNDDGEPELFAGIDPTETENGDKQRLWMYRGVGLPAYDADADQCSLWNEPPVQVGCRGGVRGVACENTAFGASLAVGDVDADGIGDLIVGAPEATVQGLKKAGTVWIIPGGEDDAASGGLDFDAMTNVYATGQKEGSLLGTSVTTVHTRDRDEPAAGAPGQDAIYVFLCTKLESEKPKTQCLPKK